MSEKTVSVTLDKPIERDSKQVDEIAIRLPMAGDLRGISLQKLMSGGAAEIQTVLKRVTSPMLTDLDFASMPGTDFILLGTEVMSFLTPSRYKEEIPTN